MTNLTNPSAAASGAFLIGGDLPVLLPILGTSKVAHIEENIAAAHLKLSAEESAAVEAAAKYATGP
jgi:aryl-alcohol dehydrogenase-like predicted oxidoreductase